MLSVLINIKNIVRLPIFHNLKFTEATTHILNRLETELPPNLYYHGPHHTKDVLEVASSLADQHHLSQYDKEIIVTAAAFHDCGFLFVYRGHEERGCEIARETLPQFDYSIEDIDKICNLIMATKVPTAAKNLFEEIICDADLDYLGRTDFDTISDSLFKEFSEHNIVSDELSWYKLQKSFLSSHHFYNEFSKASREETKQKNLRDIISMIEILEIRTRY